MGLSKRYTYVVYETVDYDGYYTYIRGVTSNYQTLRQMWEDVHTRLINEYFDGYGEDEYSDNWAPLPEKPAPQLNNNTWGNPNILEASINDDCEKWMGLHIHRIYAEK